MKERTVEAMLDQAIRAVLTVDFREALVRAPVCQVGVLCGSGEGSGGHYLAYAAELGERLGRAGVDLVYGGAAVGVLGELVRSAHGAGSEANNVVPLSLLSGGVRPVGGGVLQAVRTVDEQLKLVHRLSDGFLVLPGGVEVLRELGELVALELAGGLSRPIVLANPRGYFDPLVTLLAHAEQDSFATGAVLRMIDVADTVDDVLHLFGRTAP